MLVEAVRAKQPVYQIRFVFVYNLKITEFQIDSFICG